MELYRFVLDGLQRKSKETKYFKTRLVTHGSRQMAPRWASDMAQVQKILRLQKDAIDADAVFGSIDPRNSNTVQLKEMFQAQTLDQRRVYGGQRGSSAKQWGDQEEFATPNMLLKQ